MALLSACRKAVTIVRSNRGTYSCHPYLSVLVVTFMLAALAVTLLSLATPGLHGTRDVAWHTIRDFDGFAGFSNDQSDVLARTHPEQLCQRTLLYKFAGVHGFASEFLILVRVALLCRHFDYQLLLDDSHWNYGRWQDYFEPIPLRCTPPLLFPDKLRTSVGPANGTSRISGKALDTTWAEAPHAIWSTRHLDYLDKLLLSIFVDEDEMTGLHQNDSTFHASAPPLGPSTTLPDAYKPVFEAMSNIVGSIWIANAAMSHLVSRVTEPVRQAQLASPMLIIPAHVRLGDKHREMGSFSASIIDPSIGISENPPVSLAERAASPLAARSAPPSEGLSEMQVARYWTAALSAAQHASAERLSGVPPAARSILLIISDSQYGTNGLQAFGGVGSPHQMEAVFGLDAIADWAAGDNNALSSQRHSIAPAAPSGLESGFDEALFNAASLAYRVHSTKFFIRDLTAASQLADGFVFTGSSNVGRLCSLLTAKEKKTRNLHSVDVRWFPTAHFV